MSILSSLVGENEQKMQEQQSSKKPQNSNPNTDQAGAGLSAFSLDDLSRLTFRLADEQVRDCWSSSAVEFQTYVQRFGTVEEVDTDTWSPFDRLDYLNGLLAYCRANRRRYPFTLMPVTPPVESDDDEGDTKKEAKKA